MSGFKSFLHSKERTKEKYQTLNIKKTTHEFYKKTANFYDINITTLVNNVLEDWINKHKEEVRKDMIEKL